MYLAGFVVIARRRGFTRDFRDLFGLCLGWISTATFTPQVGKALGLRITLGGYDGGFEAGVG